MAVSLSLLRHYFPCGLTSAGSANDIDDAQDAGAGSLDKLEDGLLEMHDDSVDDSRPAPRSNTTDNSVGAAADDIDVIMSGLDAVAVAADHGSIAAVSDESGGDNDISDPDNPFGLAIANDVNCGGVPDELRGLEVISEGEEKSS